MLRGAAHAAGRGLELGGGGGEHAHHLAHPALEAAHELGELVGALGITEPGAGSNVADIRTHARRVPGGYVVNGATFRGELAIGEKFSHHSVIGTEFVGELTGTTTLGPYDAVLPTLTGSAWVMGRSTWVLDDTDPFPAGFSVGDIWAPRL